MKLTVGNLYIAKHSDGYAVHIEMPDGSRNFLHCEPFNLIEKALELNDNLEGQNITAKDIMISKHPKHQKYYRINVVLQIATMKVMFHSRALNLNDVMFERMQLMVAEE